MGSSAAAPRDDVSVAVAVAEQLAVEEDVPVPAEQGRWSCPAAPPWRAVGAEDRRRLIHAAKVGAALVLVSLLYVLEVVHDRLGDGSMWAIMTVVVVFEMTSGGTIGKGVNRVAGTAVGGGAGFLVAYAAQEAGGGARAVIISVFVFIFGAAATYVRLLPTIRRRYDYGALVFMLTFNLVSLSGARGGDEIVSIATNRLSSIAMGFAVCLLTTLLVFPRWAGDSLHRSLTSNFHKLALSFRDCAECLRSTDGKTDDRMNCISANCLSVLNSKSSDESLVGFAGWEPWHGRFGFFYPWDKCLRVAELLRQLAVPLLSLKASLHSKHQQWPLLTDVIREEGQAVCNLIGGMLSKAGESISSMRLAQPEQTTLAMLESARLVLTSQAITKELRALMSQTDKDCGGEVPVLSFLFILTGILDRVEELAEEVEELGALARFHR